MVCGDNDGYCQHSICKRFTKFILVHASTNAMSIGQPQVIAEGWVSRVSIDNCLILVSEILFPILFPNLILELKKMLGRFLQLWIQRMPAVWFVPTNRSKLWTGSQQLAACSAQTFEGVSQKLGLLYLKTEKTASKIGGSIQNAVCCQEQT